MMGTVDHPQAAITLKGLLVPADVDQAISIVALPAPMRMMFKSLARYVGGGFDLVGFNDNEIWVNERGRHNDVPMNVRVSHWLLHDSAPGREGRIGEVHMVYGDVVITGDLDVDAFWVSGPSWTSVPAEIVGQFESMQLDADAMKDWDVRSTENSLGIWYLGNGFDTGLG